MAVSGVSQTRSHLSAYEHLTLIGKSNALCLPLQLTRHPLSCPLLFHPFVGVKYSSKSPVIPASDVKLLPLFISRTRPTFAASLQEDDYCPSFYCPIIIGVHSRIHIHTRIHIQRYLSPFIFAQSILNSSEEKKERN